MRDAVDVTEKILRVIVRGNGYVSPHSLLDLIRERDAEVRADERAKVLAGFEWQAGFRDERGRTRGLLVSLTAADVPSTLTPMRRLVSPWEPTR